MQTQLAVERAGSFGGVAAGWRRWVGRLQRLRSARPKRQLKLCETLGLGEKRFLAVVQIERQRFLIGGTATSVALLSELSTERWMGSQPAEEGDRE